MKINSRVPQDFFITSGKGESDLAIHAGSYHHALDSAGIANHNLMFYTSLMPVGAKEIRHPGKEKLPHGSVLESIIAVSHAKHGERATAGILYGYLRNRQTGEEIGGLVCQYNGNLSEEEAKRELELMFSELYQASYADKYDYFDRNMIIQSTVAEKKYATALVAICFTTFLIEEKASSDCDRPFLGEQKPFDEASNIIIPVPFDATSSWLKGTELGPRAILHASLAVEDFDIETGLVVSKKGFHTTAAVTKGEPDKMVEQVQKHVTRALRHGKIPCVIGGNHTVSLGAARAVIGEHPDVSILHIDAHTDYRDEYQNSKYSHACVMKRIQEQCDNIVSVGIRSTSEEEQPFLNPAKIFYAADLMKNQEEQDEWIDEIMMQLDPDVYISIDLDAFDPSEIPAVSTPEPGGLSWSFITKLLKTVAKNHHIVGFDVVELCPNRYLRASDFAAAKLVYNTFAYIHQHRKEIA